MVQKRNNSGSAYSVRQLTLTAMFAAFVLVTTMMIAVPVPGTNGYIHLGDAAIFLAGALLGPIGGALAAGIGSMLADLLAGYAHWVVPTLIIKTVMGAAVGFLLLGSGDVTSVAGRLRSIVAMGIGGAIMVAGYLVAGAIMQGSWIVALGSVPMNIVQFVVGIVITHVVLIGIRRWRN